MAGKVTFFPVDNGDMTLITLDDERKTTILIDMNIREKADDDNDDTPDVASELRRRLQRDDDGRPYVDVFVLSHPDEDHCRGASKHLHLASIDAYKDVEDDSEKKIIVHEMWTSPIVFRRASKHHALCTDAKAINKEAKRRVKEFRDTPIAFDVDHMPVTDRIRIIGEDEDGKTDDILEIVTKVDETFNMVNGLDNGLSYMTVLGPLPSDVIEDGNEDTSDKNRSSIIMQYELRNVARSQSKCLFLTGGDAAVAVWECLADRHRESAFSALTYDLLLAPHHCSWRSLSNDSWSDLGESVQVNGKAREALSCGRSNARIVASSKVIKKEDSNPPHERAKREYVDILGDKARFLCTSEEPSVEAPEPLVFTITNSGFEPPRKKASSVKMPSIALGATATRVPHGE